MKWVFTIVLCLVLSLSLSVQGQLLVEDFDYPAGTNLTDNGWTAHSGAGTNPISVTSPGLTYSGYSGSGVGNAALLDNTGEDVNRNFSEQISGSVYASFLVSITAVPTGGGYFSHLGPTAMGTIFRARVFAQDNGSGNLEFGLAKAAGTVEYTANNYSFNTTYLLVLKYQFVSGVDNDEVSLFVFSLGVPNFEPVTPTLGPDISGTDPSNIGTIALRQFDTSQNIIVDGIRIGTSWSDSPLPVELASFTAAAGDGKVTLRWATQSEVNNERFEIMRSDAKEGQYGQIGERPGQFNSNQLTYYSFEDNFVANGTTYWYKLVDVDVNGVRTEHGPISATPQASGTEITTIDSDVPQSYKFYPAYPNPFNPSTNLKIEVPSTSRELAELTVEVYNSLGQRVRSLFHGTVEAGTYTLTWDGTTDSGLAVPGGVYFAVMKSGFYKNTVKMTLAK